VISKRIVCSGGGGGGGDGDGERGRATFDLGFGAAEGGLAEAAEEGFEIGLS
jgi:hypothetical protein